MNRFIIVDGLPFLYANGKAYAVRWDDKGFTVGAEVELASVPTRTYSEISIKAKCRILEEPEEKQEAEQVVEPEAEQDKEPEEKQEAEQVVEPEKKPAFEDMKLDDLKKYASDNGIALKGARTKAEIIEAIKSASKE